MPEWPGYRVSDHGRVRSLDRVIDTVRGPRRLVGREMHARIDTEGYPSVTLSRGGDARTIRVHRLVLTAWVGPMAPGVQSCHWTGERTDNRLINLSICTRSQNQRDSVRHGTHAGARRTHCRFRHPLAGANIAPYARRRGRRQCLACDRARSRVWKWRHAGAEVDDNALHALADWYFDGIVAAGRNAA